MSNIVEEFKFRLQTSEILKFFKKINKLVF